MNIRRNTYIFVLLILVATGLYFWVLTMAKNPTHKPPGIVINGQKLQVEWAKTPDQQALGLSGRNQLAPNTAMLFDFRAQPGPQTFWMKDMLFSIDILWIRDGKVVGVEHSLPPASPSDTPGQLPTYHSPGPVDLVLETNSGWAKENHVTSGDKLQLNE